MSISPKQFTEIKKTQDRAGKQLSFSTGKLAPQEDGSIVISLGETILLVTAVLNKNPLPDKDFLPLMIDFRESYAAAGKIG
jgi:polyribonucleotide nucleotidyltransferase